MEFKKLDLKPEGSWLRRTLQSKHIQKTAIYMVGGAVIGFVVYYLTDAKTVSAIEMGEVLNHVIVGGLFGLFVTNSPCSRGRC
nr:hypothetical protein [uncultured Carboxylicivirga sp.]